MNITFVLPGRNSSGGVRVTVEMANRLRNIGHTTRIIYKNNESFINRVVKNAISAIRGYSNIDWLNYYDGITECYDEINDLEYHDNEFVVAVGVYTIQDVLNINANVIKIRYNHGFSVGIDNLTKISWGYQPMRTIVVASTLIPRMESLSGQTVDEVIPNGINDSEYFIDDKIEHDSIGIMYSSHPNKAPDDILRLLNEISSKWPHLKILMYGADKKPNINNNNIKYKRYPSISEARCIYNKCKIWLSASKEEGFCLPILEAMACGCVVISSNSLGAMELIQHEKNGYLVNMGDIDAYLRYIKEIMADDYNARSIRDECKRTVKKYSWDNAVSIMNNYIHRISLLK